ncbi:MAG: hypothetical protein AAGA85_04560 [Bacteroidota bacterium]
MMKKLAFLLILGLTLACDEKGEPQVTCPECTGDLFCTEEFRTILFTVTAPSGEPVVLDEFEKTIVATGEILDHGDWLGQLMPGSYVIAQDSDFDKVDCDGTAIRFEGYLDGQSVVDEIFVVGRDCCHIFLVEGPDSLTIP